MKLRIIVIVFVVFVSSVAAVGSWFSSSLAAVDPHRTQTVEFIITPNQPASDVVAKLVSSGLIKNSLASKFYLRLTEMDSRLLPGAYLVSASQSTPDLFKTLTKGPKDLWITIPEGWRREQIVARLANVLVSDSSFSPTDFLSATATLEGRLFPDTYLIPAYASTTDVISIITSNFATKVAAVSHEDLILASLVEREAKLAPDRPIIAGIYKKRLREGWPLQADATIQYAEGSLRCKTSVLDCNWWQPPADTGLDSPYNTYKVTGLPPAAIANPGLASIEAVLHPEDTPYWYYITDNSGVTHFAKTLQEHNFNVDKYLRP